jgi:hypothetical protein
VENMGLAREYLSGATNQERAEINKTFQPSYQQPVSSILLEAPKVLIMVGQVTLTPIRVLLMENLY